jgi:protein O-mannosyl-transferase
MPPRSRAALYIAILALAVAASATSVANGFALDDVPLVADNAAIHTLHGWWGLFTRPYWPPQYGASLYRPFVMLGFAVQWAVGNGSPFVFHLTSIALYALASALVLALFLLLLPPAPALIAAALFAVHPVHVEAVANIVGQTELVAAVAALGAAILYVRRRRSGTLGPRSVVLIAMLFAIACLSKESGVLLPAVLVALELFAVAQDGDSWRDRLRRRVGALAPLFITLAMVGASYLVARTLVDGDVLGEKDVVPLHGLSRLWMMLAVAPHWVRLLAWPAHLSADYSPQEIPVPSGVGAEIILGALVIGTAALVFLALGRTDEAQRDERSVARLGFAWAAIGILPVSNLFSVMVLGERTLLTPSIGAMLLVGAAASALWRRSRGQPHGALMRGGLMTVAASLVVVGAIRSRDRQRVWHTSATLVAQTIVDAPRSYRAQFFYGQLMFDQGKRAEGERHLRLAIALNPTPADVSPLNYLATEYRDAGMCPQALPLYERALANDSERPDVRYGLAACLLAVGRVDDARRLARDGVQRGDFKPLFLDLIARSDSVPRTPQPSQ